MWESLVVEVKKIRKGKKEKNAEEKTGNEKGRERGKGKRYLLRFLIGRL